MSFFNQHCPSTLPHSTSQQITMMTFNLTLIIVRRWLTLAARILRLYVSTEAPSGELVHIVQYLVQHYVPTWFTIRRNSACTEGAKNVYRSIELLRGLPQHVQNIIRPVISRNGY